MYSLPAKSISGNPEPVVIRCCPPRGDVKIGDTFKCPACGTKWECSQQYSWSKV